MEINYSNYNDVLDSLVLGVEEVLRDYYDIHDLETIGLNLVNKGVKLLQDYIDENDLDAFIREKDEIELEDVIFGATKGKNMTASYYVGIDCSYGTANDFLSILRKNGYLKGDK